MAKITFNKLNKVEALEEGVISDAGKGLGSLALKGVKKLGQAYLKSFIKTVFPNEFGASLLKDVEIAIKNGNVRKAEEIMNQSRPQFLANYYKFMLNLYLPQVTPVDYDKIAYFPEAGGVDSFTDSSGVVYTSLVKNDDLVILKRWVINYLSRFETVIKTDFEHGFSKEKLTELIDKELSGLGGFNTILKNFIRTKGGILDRATNKTVSGYIAGYMEKIVTPTRAIIKAKEGK